MLHGSFGRHIPLFLGPKRGLLQASLWQLPTAMTMRGTLVLKHPQRLLSLLDPFEALRVSELGTAAEVNPSNVLVDDLSPCDGQTHAEEECGLGLYRCKVRSRFTGRDPFYKPDRPLAWVGPHLQGRGNYALSNLLLCCVSTIIISTPI